MRQPLLEEEDPVYLRFWASYSSECVPVWMPVAWLASSKSLVHSKPESVKEAIYCEWV